MVDKPTEGICSRCNSEDLEFYDDGSGRCMNCDRTFRWASEEEIAQQEGEDEIEEQKERPEPSQERYQQRLSSPLVSGLSRTNGDKRGDRRSYSPSQRGEGVERNTGRGFLWLGVLGLILMMLGYVLSSLFAMDIGLTEYESIIRGSYILLTSVGVLIAGMGMLIFGSVADDLDENIRMGLIIGSSLLIAIYLGLSQLSFFLF